jgi:hypothetical protein
VPAVLLQPARILEGVCGVVSGALKAEDLPAIGYSAAGDEVSARAEGKIAVGLATVQRDFVQPIVDAVAEALPQHFGIDFQIARWPPLERRVDRWSRAIARSIEQALDVRQPRGLAIDAWRGEEVGVGDLVIEVAQPGLQFYPSNFLDATSSSKAGKLYRQGDAFVLEPQKFPDTVNRPTFGSVRLDPGQQYRNRIMFRFSTVRR